jgi:hypothetical protein
MQDVPTNINLATVGILTGRPTMEEEPVLMKAKEGRKRHDTRRPPALLDSPFFSSHSGTDFESDTGTLGPAGFAFVGDFVTLLEVMRSAGSRGDKGDEGPIDDKKAEWCHRPRIVRGSTVKRRGERDKTKEGARRKFKTQRGMPRLLAVIMEVWCRYWPLRSP